MPKVCVSVSYTFFLEMANSPTSPGMQHRMQNWNPMESDFLGRRNILAVDDEDVGSALHGYSKLLFNLFSCTYFV